jgi:ribosomal protein S18 acetylase RimI-like enzyme
VSWFRSSRRRRRESAPVAEPELELGEGARSTEPNGADQPATVAVASPEELVGRPLADLHALAREHGVPRYRLLRKDELIETLGGSGAPRRDAVATADRAQAEAAPLQTAEPSPPVFRISEVNAVSVDLLEAVQRLVGELSSSATKPGPTDLEEIIESPVTRLIVARTQEGAVVGMLTLALFRIPTGMRAWIEDVVVEERGRGQGVGEALTREAIRIAGEHGARTIDLTSRRAREAANRMYRKLGFNRRDTTVYRMDAGES